MNGLVGNENASAGVSDKVEKAMAELSLKAERQRHAAAAAAGESQGAHCSSNACCPGPPIKPSRTRLAQAARAKTAGHRVKASGQDDDEDDADGSESEKEEDSEPVPAWMKDYETSWADKRKKELIDQERLKSQGYSEISQDEFLPEVTNGKKVLVHFYHKDFERCKIMDKHLSIIATKYPVKFLKLNAEKAPFFVQKLAVRVLPTLIGFVDGIAQPIRQVGFEGLTAPAGKEDEWRTPQLEMQLDKMGLIEYDSGQQVSFDDAYGQAMRNYLASGIGDSDLDGLLSDED